MKNKGCLTFVIGLFAFGILSGIITSIIGKQNEKVGAFIALIIIVGGYFYLKRRREKKEAIELQNRNRRMAAFRSKVFDLCNVKLGVQPQEIFYGMDCAIGVNNGVDNFCLIEFSGLEVAEVKTPKMISVEKSVLTQEEIQKISSRSGTDAVLGLIGFGLIGAAIGGRSQKSAVVTNKITGYAIKMITDDMSRPFLKLLFSNENAYDKAYAILFNIVRSHTK